MKGKIKCEVWNDSMQNWKSKPIQKAQLIIADVPYNVGTNFYGSNPMWYNGGDNKNGESKLAGKAAFKRMQNAGITGSRLYMLWNDCCGRNTEMAMDIMQNKVIDIILHHIDGGDGRGIPF